ncbi:hypothetical protein DYBT9275_00698 [Dyadobacter sp. CECT 9275]|uniref:Transmembrane protein n=1 Tax=Dyadobacter helix TaxID=2822344 RepID=A0A916NAL1_9BACT|nr:hypothetical protein DYBT9275_00698 [Dyadobacter sp. CECT 9275]
MVRKHRFEGGVKYLFFNFNYGVDQLQVIHHFLCFGFRVFIFATARVALYYRFAFCQQQLVHIRSLANEKKSEQQEAKTS